jgi:SAM-dependent methyltransferase
MKVGRQPPDRRNVDLLRKFGPTAYVPGRLAWAAERKVGLISEISPHSVYANRRVVHYRDIAERVLQLLPEGKPHVLDYGCGEAIYAELIADSATDVLCDAAPGVRGRLVQRFAGNRKIRVLVPEEVDQLPAQSFDFICANSVVQYVPPAQLGRLVCQKGPR